MKTLTINEAGAMGYPTFRYGIRRFIPVTLPREVATHQGYYDDIVTQFEGVTLPTEGDNRDDKQGRFEQTFQWTKGDGRIYIVIGFYTPENGIETWDVFGAVEL